MSAKRHVAAYVRRCLFAVLLVGAYLSPSPLPSETVAQAGSFVASVLNRLPRAAGSKEPGLSDADAVRRLRGFQSPGVFKCPSDLQAQQYYTTGVYRNAPGIEDRDNWAELFQDYMDVPYTSSWETETWNYKFVYPHRNSTPPKPTHMIHYHWHHYTDYTPAFGGNDEHLLYATPLGGDSMYESKNPYTEWADMNATVGMANVWTNRWRSESTPGGGGPFFNCPTMETSFQLVSYRGKDLRSEHYRWVLWREVMHDGLIYGSVRWIQVTDACKNDFKTCPPFDPVNKGLFGTESDPQYATRMFPKTYDNPYMKEAMQSPSISFSDHGFIDEIRGYTDTKIFVHEYFNRTSLARKFSGFGYTGYKSAAM